jgi:ATP-dependent helicase/nuclease subunit A
MFFEILDPKNSLYLDASAGSGKTKLLVDRIIKLLLTGTKPSRILCITFTKAAADEMYERLEGIILNFVTMTDDELKNKLLELHCSIRPNLIREARGLFALFMEEKPLIQTLHAFSSKILQRLHILEGEDLEEGGKILEEEERRLLFEEVFYRLLLEKTELDQEIKFLLQEYDIQYLIDLLESFWLSLNNSRTSLIKYDLPKQELERFLSELIANKLQISSNEKEINFFPPNKSEIEVSLAKLALEEEILSFLQEGLLENFSHYKNFFLTKDGKARVKLVKAQIAKDKPELEIILRKEQERLVLLEESIEKLEALKKNLAFNLFAWEVLEAFRQAKKEKNLNEYSDLIVTTHSLFSTGQGLALLYSLDLKLEHLMIDEAQDLSEMQWSLIQTITEEFFAGDGVSEKVRTIFIVGDFKQAIFGFQGSAPEIFQAIKFYYREKITGLGQGWKELKLETCYRCVPEILEIVDIFCNQDSTQDAFQVREKISHKAYKKSGLGFVKLEEVNQLVIEKSDIKWEVPGLEPIVEEDESYYIAEAIVKKISNWLKEKSFYGPGFQILPQSILILFRKRCKLQEDLVRALEEKGIPVTNLATKASTFSNIFYYFISLIQFIVQPLDDMNLFALLQGEPFNYTEEELFDLAYQREGTLWERVREVIPLLNHIRHKAQELDVESFLYYYFNKIYLTNPKEQEVFLDYFFAYSHHSLTTSYQDFLLWLEKTITEKNKKVYDNESVRITTIHSAKGLEAPLVILADAALSDNTSLKRFAQVGPLILLKSKATASLIEEEEKREARERLRLLYVAMTRAQYELHIFGNNNKDNSWFSKLSSFLSK